MKRIVIMIVSLLLSLYTAQAQTPIHPQDSIALVGVWEDFRLSFADKDLSKLKTLSTSKIYCSECYDNTEKEKLRNAKLMQTNKWETFMDKMYYVSQKQFLQEDVAIISGYIGSKIKTQFYHIYNDETNKKLFTKKLKKKQLSYPIQRYSIIITITEPSPEFEGLQAIFTFVKTKKGFQFCGYGTVP